MGRSRTRSYSKSPHRRHKSSRRRSKSPASSRRRTHYRSPERSSHRSSKRRSYSRSKTPDRYHSSSKSHSSRHYRKRSSRPPYHRHRKSAYNRKRRSSSSRSDDSRNNSKYSSRRSTSSTSSTSSDSSSSSTSSRSRNRGISAKHTKSSRNRRNKAPDKIKLKKSPSPQRSQGPSLFSSAMNFLDAPRLPEMYDDINANNFTPKTFNSGGNTATKKHSDKVVINLKSETFSVTKVNVTEPEEDPLFHQNFYQDETVRMEKWVKKLHNYRVKMFSHANLGSKKV